MDDLTTPDDLLWEDDIAEEELPPPPRWRRPVLIAVAFLTAVALAIVPVYNLFRPSPPRSDTGLEICGLDYCTVQEAVTEAGLLSVMSGLSNTFLTDAGAQAFADDIADYLDVDPVSVEVVDRLEGSLGGVYQPATRTMFVRRPVRAWTVAHEMAHVMSTGHGDEFVSTLIRIARWAAGAAP